MRQVTTSASDQIWNIQSNPYTTTIVQYPKDSHMAGGAPPLNSVAVCQQPECMMRRKQL